MTITHHNLEETNRETDRQTATHNRASYGTHSVPGDFFIVLSVVSLSVEKSVIDDDECGHEVYEFARGQHAEVRPRVTTSVAVAERGLFRNQTLISNRLHVMQS